MIWLLIPLVMLLFGLVLSWLVEDGFPAAAFGAAATLLAAALILCMMTNRVGVGGEMAQLNQVKVAAATVDPAAFRDIYSEILDWNKLIADNKWCRHQWWARDFVSARWDTVTSIPIH